MLIALVERPIQPKVMPVWVNFKRASIVHKRAARLHVCPIYRSNVRAARLIIYRSGFKRVADRAGKGSTT
jgi:hypothetical protein